MSSNHAPTFFPSSVRNYIMLGEEVRERSHDEQHVEVGLRRITLLQMEPLHQMHEGHIDEIPRHRVPDLFDEPNRLVAVQKCGSLTHAPPGYYPGSKEGHIPTRSASEGGRDPVRFPRWRVGLICSSMRNFLAGVIVERCQGAEVGLKSVGSDVDASTDCASEDSTVQRHNHPFTLPPEENDGAVRACAASGTPSASGVTLDLLGQASNASTHFAASRGNDLTCCIASPSIWRGCPGVSCSTGEPLLSCMRIRSSVGVTRFELVTSCSQGRRANQAALHPATSIRHSHRTRTQASWSRAGHVQTCAPTNRRNP